MNSVLIIHGLVKLDCCAEVEGKAGDYLVHEVGTDGTHIIKGNAFFNIYDDSHPVGLDILTQEEKYLMPEWEDALSQGVRFFVHLKMREFLIVTKRTMEILLYEWVKEKVSTDENGTVAIENPKDVPINQSIFKFVHNTHGLGSPSISVYQVPEA